MSLVTLATALLRAFQSSMQQQACADLLALDDHMVADLGLRREDLWAGLWQPAGNVDSTPPRVKASSPSLVFGDGWPQLL